MTIQAGFAEIDITPPLGTHKIGWLKDIVSDHILTPLFARVALFQTASDSVAIVQLDTLFIDRPEVQAIRRSVQRAYGVPGDHIILAATHNHAGPAVARAGEVAKDVAYTAYLVSRVIAAFGQAVERLEPAQWGFGRGFEWRVAHNRRVVMRDGTARTHGTFDDPQALYLEGPIDPELAVIGVRSAETGDLLGALVNYACHPTHHGGDGAIDAGYPGVLATALRERGCPVTLFLNGASGNVHTSDPAAGGKGMSAQDAGETLAHGAWAVLQEMPCDLAPRLSGASRDIELPYHHVTADELAGQVRGGQRFIDPAIYDRAIPSLLERIEQRGTERAEIQALLLGDCALVGIPGELFVEFGLQIKEGAHPVRALIASCANGRVGYIPTAAAFRRGGYETTFGPPSMLAPEAGAQIAEAAIDLIRHLA